MKENKNKSYVLYIKGVEAFKNYKIPNVHLIETESLTEKQMADIESDNWISVKKRYNKRLWKMLKEIYAKQLKIDSIWIDSSIANLSFELSGKKGIIHTFRIHTADSVLDFNVFKTKKEIGKGNSTPFFFIDSFPSLGSYSGRNVMRTSQYENIFNAAREFGNRYAEVNGDCSGLLNPKVGKEDSSTASKKDARPIHTPIKIDKDKCTIKFNVGGFTEKDCSLGELANKLGENEAKQGDNISATIKLAPDRLEANLINNLLQILDDKCLGISSSTILADKVAMILHEVEHYKFQKDFDGDRVSISFPIDATNLVDDDKRVNYTPECSIPLADKEIASKKAEEVSEYLDNAEYDLVVNKITKDISMHYRYVKTAGRHMFSIPSDFRERLCDLSYLPDLENRFKQFDNIGILQQELLLKSKDEDMLESIEELTFAQVLELFTVLADMKGMIKIKDEESGEYCLKHLEKKAELIVNDIKVEVYPTTVSAEKGEVNPLPNDEIIEKIKRDLTEPAIEPNMDDLLAASDTDTMVVLKDGKILYVCDNNFLFSSSSKESVIRNHAELDIGAGYEKEEFIKVDKEIDMDRFNFFKKCPSATGKNISEVYVSKEFLNDEVIIVLAKTKREKDVNKAELMFVRRGDTEYNKRFEDGSKYAVLSSSLDNELYNAIKKRIANFVDSAKLIDYINVPNLLFAYLKTYGEFDNIRYVYVDTSVHYKIKNDELDDAQCLADTELDSLETTQMELDGYKKLTSRDYIMITPEDDIFKCPEIPRFKNKFAGVGIVTPVEDNLDIKEKENNELVFIVLTREKDTYDIICKTKKELDFDENLSNYRARFINPETQLFGLIKNDLLNLNNTLNLTREQINGVTKIYVPSHTVGLFYKITENDYNNHTVDIVFSYSQESFNRFNNKVENKYYVAFQDFQDECTK